MFTKHGCLWTITVFRILEIFLKPSIPNDECKTYHKCYFPLSLIILSSPKKARPKLRENGSCQINKTNKHIGGVKINWKKVLKPLKIKQNYSTNLTKNSWHVTNNILYYFYNTLLSTQIWWVICIQNCTQTTTILCVVETIFTAYVSLWMFLYVWMNECFLNVLTNKFCVYQVWKEINIGREDRRWWKQATVRGEARWGQNEENNMSPLPSVFNFAPDSI